MRGRRSWKRAKSVESGVIQMAPFMDVVLVLLIVFIAVAPSIVSGIDVSLPTGGSEVSQKNPIIVSYTGNKRIFVDDKEVSHSGFVSFLLRKTSGNKATPIFIKGDKDLSYGEIVGMVTLLNRSGFTETILVTNLPDKS